MSSSNPNGVGNPDAALASAAKIVEAEYEFPFQGHTALGPAHGMADPNGPQVTFAGESFIDELAAAAKADHPSRSTQRQAGARCA